MSPLHDALWFLFYLKTHLYSNLTHEKMWEKNGYAAAVLKKRNRKRIYKPPSVSKR